MFLTIDLVGRVLEEALALQADLIVSYHPPIFSPLKRLRPADPREAIILRAVEAGLAIYSPHTALDVAVGGVNDWLAEGLGAGTREPIEPIEPPAGAACAPTPGAGQGRLVSLAAPRPLDAVLGTLKSHLGVESLRVAAAGLEHRVVGTVALAAGAGASVLAKAPAVDLWLTGEMRHHDVLEANERGTIVVLAEHTNTERGALASYAEQIRAALGESVEVRVSATDADPLTSR